ncbi:hypothetical protein INR49_018450 [Caranx melampygus]|nr:hypothetical protein INR49_018450 [Caranx melampygus]
MKLQASHLKSPPYTNVKVWSTMAPGKAESHSVAAVAQDNNFPTTSCVRGRLQRGSCEHFTRNNNHKGGRGRIREPHHGRRRNPVKQKAHHWLEACEKWQPPQEKSCEEYMEVKCYVCQDEDKCPKLIDIYERDVSLYSKDKDGSQNALQPALQSLHCVKELHRDVVEIDVEADDGSTIGNLSAVDEWPQPYSRANTGLTPGLMWTVLAVAAAFVIQTSLCQQMMKNHQR